MKDYRVKGNTPFGLIDFVLSHDEVLAAKQQVKSDGDQGYAEMMRLMSHPAAIVRYCMIPGTQLLRYLLNICIIGGRLMLVCAVVLLFMRQWWWSIGLIASQFAIVSRCQTALNYEIGARLLALDQRLHEIEDDERVKGVKS